MREHGSPDLRCAVAYGCCALSIDLLLLRRIRINNSRGGGDDECRPRSFVSGLISRGEKALTSCSSEMSSQIEMRSAVLLKVSHILPSRLRILKPETVPSSEICRPSAPRSPASTEVGRPIPRSDVSALGGRAARCERACASAIEGPTGRREVRREG